MMDFINSMDTGDWVACSIGLFLALLTCRFTNFMKPYAGANRGGRRGPSLIVFFILLLLCFPLALIYVVWPRRRQYGGRAYLSRGEMLQLERIEAMELRAKLGRWNNDRT